MLLWIQKIAVMGFSATLWDCWKIHYSNLLIWQDFWWKRILTKSLPETELYVMQKLKNLWKVHSKNCVTLHLRCFTLSLPKTYRRGYWKRIWIDEIKNLWNDRKISEKLSFFWGTLDNRSTAIRNGVNKTN